MNERKLLTISDSTVWLAHLSTCIDKHTITYIAVVVNDDSLQFTVLTGQIWETGWGAACQLL